MRAEDIRAFAARPFAEVERLKQRHWATTALAGEGPGLPTLGELLYEHAREANPAFPSERYLREDWEHHLRLRELLDRAQTAFQTR